MLKFFYTFSIICIGLTSLMNFYSYIIQKPINNIALIYSKTSIYLHFNSHVKVASSTILKVLKFWLKWPCRISPGKAPDTEEETLSKERQKLNYGMIRSHKTYTLGKLIGTVHCRIWSLPFHHLSYAHQVLWKSQ